MKLLIDPPQSSAARAPFWRDLQAALLSTQAGPQSQTFILQRSTQPPDLKANFLDVPAAEFTQSVLEDRRLAALCSELNIDLFVSANHTSAGGIVPSALVFTDSSVQDCAATSAVLESTVRAARSAAVLIADSSKAAAYLAQASEIPLLHIRISHTPREAARVIEKSLGLPVPETIEILRREEESRTAAESRRRRALAEAEIVRLRNLTLDGRPKAFIPRVWRAVRNVNRYPEYIRRILS